MFHSNLCSRV